MTAPGTKRSRIRGASVVDGIPLRFDSPRRTGLAKIKIEMVRLGNNGTRERFKFAERLMKAIPELKNA